MGDAGNSDGQARTFTVTEDDDGIRLDRWFKRHLPEASFNIVSRWARTGQLRLDGKRATPGDRIEAGQQIRVPPPEAAPERSARPKRAIEPLSPEEAELVRSMVIHSDAHAFVLAKPPGLATQGGTKTHHHLAHQLGFLGSQRLGRAQRPS
ncbi:MAG TPA: RNA pseudouridine synthase, partial [Sphingomicrobium sp.]|nr:RNA pseudouridine synthase [Sphingomicrobium sp.]